MKKLSSAFLVIALLFASQIGFSATTNQAALRAKGRRRNFDFLVEVEIFGLYGEVLLAILTNSFFCGTYTGDVAFRTNLIANGRYGNASTVLFSSSTAFQQTGIPYAIIYKAIGNAAETTLLPQGTPGQEVMFEIYAVGPSGTWKLQPDTGALSPAGGVKSIGFDSIQFSTAVTMAKLIYWDDFKGWQLMSWTGSPTIAVTPLKIQTLSGNTGG